MDRNGNSYPFVPYYLLLDIDIGLFRLLKERYYNKDIFGTGILDAPVQYQRYFLWKRRYVNPLRAIAYDPDDKDLFDDYYDQFMDKELDFILRHSETTNLYEVIRNTVEDQYISTSVWVPDERIKHYLENSDAAVFRNLDIRVSKDMHDSFDNDFDEPFYFKDIMDIIRNYDVTDGKNIYLASYMFNFDDIPDEKGEYTLNSKVMDVIANQVRLVLFDPYQQNEYKVIKS